MSADERSVGEKTPISTRIPEQSISTGYPTPMSSSSGSDRSKPIRQWPTGPKIFGIGVRVEMRAVSLCDIPCRREPSTQERHVYHARRHRRGDHDRSDMGAASGVVTTRGWTTHRNTSVTPSSTTARERNLGRIPTLEGVGTNAYRVLGRWNNDAARGGGNHSTLGAPTADRERRATRLTAKPAESNTMTTARPEVSR